MIAFNSTICHKLSLLFIAGLSFFHVNSAHFQQCQAETNKPNIILIYTDDQGYGDMSYLNPESKFQTPHLDQLAREGLVFTDGHSSDTVCTPSRYGLLTGRYNWRTTLKKGVFGAEKPCLIEDGRMTIPSMLRESGYQTAMIGKWHLGMDFPGTFGERDWTQPVKDMPLDKGFDYFWGIPASMNYGVLAWFEGRYAKVPPTLYTRKKLNQIAINDYRIMPDYDKKPKQKKSKELEVAPDFIDSQCLTKFTDKTIAWINRVKDQDKPWFVYLPYTSPHKPVIPLPEFRGQGEAGAYGEFMIETDHHIGRIMAFLKKHGLSKNTMVIVSSDNGPETTWRERKKKFNHHSNYIYRGGKRDIYEGGHRVPFIVRWPNGIQAGKSAVPVCQTDILATLAQMLNRQIPDNAAEDSQSFHALFKDPSLKLKRLPMIHHAIADPYAIRDGDWKLIMPGRSKKSQFELYNLAMDPGETENLADKQPEIVKTLTKKITDIVKNGRTTPGKPQANDGPQWWAGLTWIAKDN